ncbi:MAG TPA: hypothetical protein VGS11_12330 [Candidatus Bathyarchaeia archaeon]|nr:hypothetical protein [Candidatus Bathyarchaeia archaeon]
MVPVVVAVKVPDIIELIVAEMFTDPMREACSKRPVPPVIVNGPGESRFHPRTLTNHLQHLEDLLLVRIERVKNSDRCSLTGSGEKVAAMVIANETGIPVGPTKEKLDLLFDEANSNPPILDDFAVNIALPSYFPAHTSGAHTEQIKFHRRRRLRELDWYGKGPNTTGIEILSIMENLANLSSTSVQFASADLRTNQSPGWQTIS